MYPYVLCCVIFLTMCQGEDSKVGRDSRFHRNPVPLPIDSSGRLANTLCLFGRPVYGVVIEEAQNSFCSSRKSHSGSPIEICIEPFI